MFGRGRGQERAQGRFRRRLTTIFVLVVAVSTGAVALVTFVVAREYRTRNFRSESISEARFTVAVAPIELDDVSFERLRLGYEARSDASLLARRGDRVFSSARNLNRGDIPDELLDLVEGEVATVRQEVNGRPTFVVAERDNEGVDYYFFFSMRQMEASIRELARIVGASWVVVLLAAGAFSWRVTRRTLRPVADVAATAEAIASGDLGARLPDGVGDELGTLATSFNHMADEVQLMVARLEAAAARERRFTADVAHELRTPLTGMSATSTILREHLPDLPQPLRRSAAVLVGDVERMRDLVIDLLELAQLDARRDRPLVEPLRPLDAALSVIRSFGPEQAASIDIDIDADLVVLADPTRLRRILANLIANATWHGRPPVRLSAEIRAAEQVVELHIVDDGPGLDADALEHVFDRFYKSGGTRAAGGSGLGLAISREHARSQGGDIVASNEPTGGARFTLSLPAATAP